MIKFKFNVAMALESAGITSYTARKSKLFSSDTWRKIKENNANVSMETLNKICIILNMQPEHLLVYEPDKKEENDIRKKLNI